MLQLMEWESKSLFNFSLRPFSTTAKVTKLMLQHLWWLKVVEIVSLSNLQISPVTILIDSDSSWLLLCTVTLSLRSLVIMFICKTPHQFAECMHTPKTLHVVRAHKLKNMHFVFLIIGGNVFFLSLALRSVSCSMQMVAACQYILQLKTLCSLTSSAGGISEAQGLMNGTSLETALEFRF